MRFGTIRAEPIKGLYSTREALPMRRGGFGRKVEAPCIFWTEMKKTLVYIDGYNLYYGLLKGLPSGVGVILPPFQSLGSHTAYFGMM